MKIGYKVIAALCAFAVVIVALFVPLISIRMNSIAASILVTIGQAKGNSKAEEIIKNNNGELASTIGEDIAIADLLSPEADSIASVITDLGDAENSAAKEQIEYILNPVLAFLVTLILVLACAVATGFVAIFAKDNRKVIYCALSGLGLSYMLIPSFKAIAEPFLDSTITLGTLTDSIWVSLLGEISDLGLGPAVYGFIALFAIIIVWTVLYNYTLPEKEKLERKIMLGEAD